MMQRPYYLSHRDVSLSQIIFCWTEFRTHVTFHSITHPSLFYFAFIFTYAFYQQMVDPCEMHISKCKHEIRWMNFADNGERNFNFVKADQPVSATHHNINSIFYIFKMQIQYYKIMLMFYSKYKICYLLKTTLVS